MRALLRDALQLVASGTSSTRPRPALRTSRSTSGMSRIVTSGGGWTRVIYQRPRISYPHARSVGHRSRLELLSGARRGLRRGARGSVGTSGSVESPRRLNTLTLHEILGMAQQSITGFERLVDGVVPVDTDMAVSDKVAVATIRSLRQVANRVSNWSQYRIGRLLQTLVINDGSPRAEVLAGVSNAAQAESSLRQSIARECAADSCALCTATTRHEDEGQSGTTPYPCEVVQAQIKLAEHVFINFSPTFLSQCMVVARDVPMGNPADMR